MKHYFDVVQTPTGQAILGASITLKLSGTNTNAVIYSDDGITPIANPVTTDSLGRFSFFVADGLYDLIVSAGNASYTISKLEITDVLEVNAADTPWSAIKLLLTGGNANITGLVVQGPLSNNTITLFGTMNTLNPPGTLTSITGNSSDQDYTHTTVPANYLTAFKGLRIVSFVKHTTGTANVAYRLSVGGVFTTAITPTGAASQIDRIVYELAFSSATTATVVTTLIDSTITTPKFQIDNLTGLNITNSTVFSMTFNVANTDAVTPQMNYFEIIQ